MEKKHTPLVDLRTGKAERRGRDFEIKKILLYLADLRTGKAEKAEREREIEFEMKRNPKHLIDLKTGKAEREGEREFGMKTSQK